MDYTIEKDERITYKLTRNGPDDYTQSSVHLASLTSSLYRFLYEHFRGSLRLNLEGEPFGTIRVSPSGIAYFIKLILVEVYGNSLVISNFKCTQRLFAIEIQHKLGDADLSYALKVARMSGFDVDVYETDRIVISTRVIPDTRPRFYNPGANYLDNIIAYVFTL